MNMKFHLFLFTCILICGYASAQNIRQVAGMDLSVAYQEYGGIMAGKSVTGEAARVAGVQACYSGPRLYDTPQTKEMVTEVIRWYKKYRNILNSDIIHLRRPDARDWDGLMHVNPNLKEKGFAMFYNPTDTVMVRTIKLPLYYSGLTQKARVREQEGKPVTYRLDRNYAIELKVTIPANGYTWYVIEQ